MGIDQCHKRQGTPANEISKVTVTTVKYPKQTINKECRYYVMKFIDDIILSELTT